MRVSRLIVGVASMLFACWSAVVPASAADISYVYDPLGRLIGVIDPASDTAVYRYDAVGNLLSISRHLSTSVSIIQFTPNQGPHSTTITISGTGFSSDPAQNVVSFNGTAASVISATPTEIVADVPAGATTGSVTVVSPAGSATSGSPFTIAPSEAPTITSFTPTIGAPTSAVTITGTNFETARPNNKVKFNISAADVTSATTTTLGVTVPSGTSGRLKVQTPAGTAVSGDDFFIPPSPHTAADVEVTGRMAFGQSRQLTLSAQNKIALLVFDATAGQQVSVGVVAPSNCANVFLIQPDGTKLSMSPSSDLDLPIPMTGTYTIFVVSCSTTAVSRTIYLSTDITGPITVNGDPVTVSIVPGQNVRLTFQGLAGQYIQLAGVNGTIPCCAGYGIVPPSGPALLWICLGCGEDVDVTLPVDGTYAVLMNAGSLAGAVTFYLSSAISTPITINGPPVSFTLRPGQNARLPFNGTAGQRLTIGATNVTLPCCSGHGIETPEGANPVWVCLECPGDADQQLTTSGTHIVEVNSGPRSGNATLHLSEEVSGTVVVNGSPVSVVTSRPAQNTRLSFDAAAGDQITVQLTSNTSCIRVSLRTSTNAVLTSVFSCDSAFNLTPQTLATAGTYAVLVEPNGNGTTNVNAGVTKP